MLPEEAALFSVDMIASRGREDWPTLPLNPKVPAAALNMELRTVAALETIAGHLLIPIAISYVFWIVRAPSD